MTTIETIRQMLEEDKATLAALPRTENGLTTPELVKTEQYLRSSIRTLERVLRENENTTTDN